jgi:hypothetical protein
VDVLISETAAMGQTIMMVVEKRGGQLSDFAHAICISCLFVLYLEHWKKGLALGAYWKHFCYGDMMVRFTKKLIRLDGRYRVFRIAREKSMEVAAIVSTVTRVDLSLPSFTCYQVLPSHQITLCPHSRFLKSTTYRRQHFPPAVTGNKYHTHRLNKVHVDLHLPASPMQASVPFPDHIPV